MKKILIVLAVILALLIAAGLTLFILKPRQPSAPRDLASPGDLDAYFTEITQGETPPGLSITVLKEGRTVYDNAFGYADGPESIAAARDTVYHWWSATKLVTSLAILQLIDRDKLEFGDSLGDFLPDFVPVNEEGEEVRITIEQLLNHTSGLPDIMPDGLNWIHGAGDEPVKQSALFREKMAGEYNVVKFTPGSQVKYTNLGYIILGVVIEKVTGVSYEEYVRQEILEPLEMESTWFYLPAEEMARSAAGSLPVIDIFTALYRVYGKVDFFKEYVRERVGGRYWLVPVYTDYTPSTGLSGTAGDLAVLGHFIMTGRTPGGSYPDILSPGLLEAMQVPFLMDELDRGYARGGCFGWGLKAWKYGGTRLYGHGGGGPGFGTILAFDPVRQLVVAVTSNDTAMDRDEIVEAVLEIDWDDSP